MKSGDDRTQDPIKIGGLWVRPGQVEKLEIPVARLPTQTHLSIPVAVVHGIHPGPRIWVSAAIHGDEINGVEIIRLVLEKLDARKLSGSVIAVPIVNVFGFINQSRYLPDRRDLNRCFPGSPRGSLASRIAHLFMSEIVAHSTHGIDLHTASPPRINWPQVRGNLKDPAVRRLAGAFGAPIQIHSRMRDGSLREAAARRGIPILVYEAGEPQRFHRKAIRVGVRGVLRVLSHLGMGKFAPQLSGEGLLAWSSSWVRARRSGLFHPEVDLGERVVAKQRIGLITDAFGEMKLPVRANLDGVVIGLTRNPLVGQGDGIVHVAQLDTTISHPKRKE